MWFKGLFALDFISVAAMMVLAGILPRDMIWIVYVLGIISLIVSVMLARGVFLPTSTAIRGMELISSQDFNNRLTKVGEHNADKIVVLFNSLIDRLRNERLRNLEQNSLLKLLIEASPMGVMMLDLDGKIDMVNRSLVKITEVSDPDVIIGKAPEDLELDIFDKMTLVPLGENRIIRRGDVRMYRCYHLSFVQTGFPRHFYLLESLTEEVMKAEREAYEKVIRIISHEVNNTMGGVKSVLELLIDSVDEDVKEVIESCDDRCDKMCGFISSYADVVKVPDPVMMDVELNDEIGAMMPFLRGIVPECIKFDFHPGQEKIGVKADISLLQQVVVNIVKNAVESIDGTGSIDVWVSTINGRGCLAISNDGAPIPDDVSRKLFSPFFTTKKEGRGLGLTLISEILKRHGAFFSLRTGSDGITRFQIQFAPK